MRKAFKKVLAFVLCAAMVLTAAGLSQVLAADTQKPESTSQASTDKYVYAKADEATFVPSGYTYVYTGENGQVYTREAPCDMYVSTRVLTTDEAEALATLEYGQEGFMTGADGSVLQCREFDAAEASAYSDAVKEILGGAEIKEGQKVSVLSQAYAKNDPVKVMITFESDSVLDMDAMQVQLGEPLGTAELNAMRSIETEQKTLTKTISAKLGYDIQVSDQFSLLTNAVSATVKYGDLTAINQMAGVKKAFLMPKFAVPEIDANTVEAAADIVPNLKYAGPAMGANGAWDLGYQGEGMSVAIIDTGLCFENPSFDQEPQDLNKVAYAKNDIEAILASEKLHAKEMTEGLTVGDVYYSSKVPYGYNYADGEANFGSDDETWFGHGSHVAGIVAGNLPEDAKVEFDMDQMGIAPEAQLVIMKVFDQNGQCYFDYLVAAIEDAILLGVDCANLSLGAACGPMYYEGVTEVYDAAYAAGINVVVSAGNEAFTGYQSYWGNDMVESSSVSTGTIGMPGTFDSVLTVASAENSFSIEFNPGISWDVGNGMRGMIGYAECPDVPEGKGFQDVLGAKEYAYTDSFQAAANKLVFVPFEGGNADGIAEQAKAANASGVLLYDPTPVEGEEYNYIEFTLTKFDVPMASTCFLEYDFMLGYKTDTLRVDGQWNPSSTAGEMSSFSSWGPTDGLTLKPEITGIGGNVFSAYYGEYFAVASGTSMSSPAVAATSALLRQYLKGTEIKEADFAHVVNCLLMSTATPIVDEAHDTYYFARRQGAGMVNVASAIASQAYIQVEGSNKAKLELGDDPNRTGEYKLSFQVVNFSNEAKTYTLDTTVLGQKADGGQIKDGKVTYLVYDYAKELSASVTSDLTDGNLTVPANSTANVTVTVKLSAADKAYIDERFPYGSYVEGFVQLLSKDTANLSVPFLAFYGDFGEGPALEEGTYDTLLGGDRTYATADQFHNAIWSSLQSYDREELHFVAEDWYLGDTRAPGFSKVPVGGFSDNIHMPFYSINAGISPNGDENLDLFYMGLGLKRNAKGIKYTVTNENTGKVIWEQTTTDPVSKSYYDSNNATVMYGGIYESDALSYDWLYPLVTEEIDYGDGEVATRTYYDTSRCLLEENTLVTIRAEVTPEYQSKTPNANDSVEFTLYIDSSAPCSKSSCFGFRTETSNNQEFIDEGNDVEYMEYSMYYIKAAPDEYWFMDYDMTGTFDYDVASGEWGGFVMTSVYATDKPAEGEFGWGENGTSLFDENSKYMYLGYDYAGNVSAFELSGGQNLLDYVELTVDKDMLHVGDQVKIQNTSDNLNKMDAQIEWVSSNPDVAEIVESDGVTCKIEAKSCGIVKISGGFGEYKKDIVIRVVDPKAEKQFTDISKHWAKNDIVAAASTGLFKGTTNTTFSPENAMTRAQLVTVLYRMEGEPKVEGKNPFTDVPANTWYTNAVVWACENEIVKGKAVTVFAPNSYITREEFATILYRYAGFKGMDVTASSELSVFTDAGKVSNFAKEAMSWAVGSGLMNGVSADVLRPAGTATRAQGATMLMRFQIL